MPNYPESMRLFDEQRAAERAKREQSKKAKLEVVKTKTKSDCNCFDIPKSGDLMVTLGTLKLSCRSRKYTIANLAKRLAPRGMYAMRNGYVDEQFHGWRDDGSSKYVFTNMRMNGLFCAPTTGVLYSDHCDHHHPVHHHKSMICTADFP